MKAFKLFLAAILITATVTHSRPAKATVGAFVSVPVLVVGIVITGGTYLATKKMVRDCGGDGLCGLGWLFAIPVMFVGLIVLDGEQDIQFRELNEVQAARLGVSSEELAIYNSEVDQANTLLAEVKSELSKLENPKDEDSAQAWGNVKDLVSPETFATMQKIVTQK